MCIAWMVGRQGSHDQESELNKMNGVDKGRCGEDLAVAFLLERGYRILNRNWRVKSGEIDIIAEINGWLVFCEVKSRSSLCCGSGAEAVDGRKQQRIIRTAMLYLQRYHRFNNLCRFDVIEILMSASDHPELRHIKNAFGA